jgi:TonB family protein
MSAGATSAGAATPHYQFHSELAQYCFPAASRDSYAKYAYANSVFFAFLLIGVTGIAKTPVISERALPEVQQYTHVELPPPAETPPPPEPEQLSEPEPDDAPPTVFAPIVVAAMDPSLSFPVQLETTNVVIAKIAALAPPPPAYVPPDRPAVAAAPRVERFRLGGGGPRGIFPNPPFYSGLLRSGQSAAVTIYLEVSADGEKTLVEVKQSSGVPDLDRRVLQHVKTRWRFDAPGVEKRYDWVYEMRAN